MVVDATDDVVHTDGGSFPEEIVFHDGRAWAAHQRAEVYVTADGPGADEMTAYAVVRAASGQGYSVSWYTGNASNLQVQKITSTTAKANNGWTSIAISGGAPTVPFWLGLEAETVSGDVVLTPYIDDTAQDTRTDLSTNSPYTTGDVGFGQYMNADDSAGAGDAANAISQFRARDV